MKLAKEEARSSSSRLGFFTTAYSTTLLTLFMLADYAVRVENSRGRRIRAAARLRNDFQRDRDVSFTPALSAAGSEDAGLHPRYSILRNRLTHTIEVAQISRTTRAAWTKHRLVEALGWCTILASSFRPLGEKALDTAMRQPRAMFDHTCTRCGLSRTSNFVSVVRD